MAIDPSRRDIFLRELGFCYVKNLRSYYARNRQFRASISKDRDNYSVRFIRVRDLLGNYVSAQDEVDVTLSFNRESCHQEIVRFLKEQHYAPAVALHRQRCLQALLS